MNAPYPPPSQLLLKLADGEIPLEGGDFADQNLRQLLALMGDPDPATRDWATFLLAVQNIDKDEVREALLRATDDEDASVRAEALMGLAERGDQRVVPLVVRDLDRSECDYGTFQAAEKIAAPVFLEGLRKWRGSSGPPHYNSMIEAAITACEAEFQDAGQTGPR